MNAAQAPSTSATDTQSKATTPPRKWLAPLIVTAIVVFAAIARGCMLFNTPLLPGMNGGYYLVQARALIEQHKLGIPDLPLTFVVQALFAKLVQLFSGASLESSIVFAVKCADALFPALVAVPMFALARRWANRIGAGLWLPACVALAAAAGAPALSMVGDFQKNSLGLVWLAALLWSLHVWLDTPTTRHAARAVLFLTLTGLTHIGVFGWALSLTGLAMLVALWRCDSATRRKIIPWMLAGGAACALAGTLVVWKFDPARVQRLASAISHPLTYLQNEKPFHTQANGQAASNAQGPDGFRPQNGGNFPGGNMRGGPGGPGGGGPGMMAFGGVTWAPTAAFMTASLGALLMVVIRRKALTAGDFAIAVGCGLGLLALTGPWVTGDKVMRFRLIAVGPALVCAAFALMQLRWAVLRNIAIALVALALVVPGVQYARRGGHPIITQEAADELRAMSAQVESPANTLVVARHGLEWWTAWFLHTHIAHMNSVSAEDWAKFEHVYFLRQKGGMQMPGGPRPGMMGQRGNFRPDGLQPQNDQRGQRPQGEQFRPEVNPEFAGDLPPRGEFRGDFPPDDFGPRDNQTGQNNQRQFPPRGMGRMGGGMMGEPVIPRNADITHEGKYFTLALVAEPIGFPGSQLQARQEVRRPMDGN